MPSHHHPLSHRMLVGGHLPWGRGGQGTDTHIGSAGHGSLHSRHRRGQVTKGKLKSTLRALLPKWGLHAPPGPDIRPQPGCFCSSGHSWAVGTGWHRAQGMSPPSLPLTPHAQPRMADGPPNPAPRKHSRPEPWKALGLQGPPHPEGALADRQDRWQLSAPLGFSQKSDLGGGGEGRAAPLRPPAQAPGEGLCPLHLNLQVSPPTVRAPGPRRQLRGVGWGSTGLARLLCLDEGSPAPLCPPGPLSSQHPPVSSTRGPFR